jgi:hypothetical protein
MRIQIENELPPFNNSPYSEDAEPPHLSEWMDAEAGIELVGRSCVALLSDALKIYLNTLRTHVIGFTFTEYENALGRRIGFVGMYKQALGEIFDTDWRDTGVNFEVIEQVVLARNRVQHGDYLMSYQIRHDPRTLSKYPNPLFANALEVTAWEDAGSGEESLLAPSLRVSKETLFTAISEIEKLTDWIEQRIDRAYDWRRRQSS